MNQALWNKIQQYDLDKPWNEYGFSARLANENYWTKNFTAKAIGEYKKFMYLAATSDLMVSPSGIVDAVWHQHLIFTQSYQEFCKILGKVIQHVPSTHNREDFIKFKQAKERTDKLYKSVFGERPADVWEYSGMYESLELEKAATKIRTFILLGILVFVGLIAPAYFLLRPFYLTLNNLSFLIGLAILSLAVFIGLDIYNSFFLSAVIRGIKSSSFVYDLDPLELVYLQSRKLSNVVHGVVGPLITDRVVSVHNDSSLSKNSDGPWKTLEEHQVMTTLGQTGRRQYSGLLRVLMGTPVFNNTANSMDAFKKYFNKSKKFAGLFYLNFGLLSLLLMAGLVRILTGVLRDKSVGMIVIFTVFLTALIIWFLNRLTHLVRTEAVPDIYLRNPNHRRKTAKGTQAWRWTYFESGPDVLPPIFIPLVNEVDSRTSRNNDSSNDCGSSCGSSCGGCGDSGDWDVGDD